MADHSYRELTHEEKHNLLTLILKSDVDSILKLHPWIPQTSFVADILIDYIKQNELYDENENLYNVVLTFAKQNFFFNSINKMFFIQFLPNKLAVNFCNLVKLSGNDAAIGIKTECNIKIKLADSSKYTHYQKHIKKRNIKLDKLASVLLALDLSDKSWCSMLWMLTTKMFYMKHREYDSTIDYFNIFKPIMIKLAEHGHKVLIEDIQLYCNSEYFLFEIWEFLNSHGFFDKALALEIMLKHKKHYPDKITDDYLIKTAVAGNFAVTKKAWSRIKGDLIEPIARLAKSQARIVSLANVEQINKDVYQTLLKIGVELDYNASLNLAFYCNTKLALQIIEDMHDRGIRVEAKGVYALIEIENGFELLINLINKYDIPVDEGLVKKAIKYKVSDNVEDYILLLDKCNNLTGKFVKTLFYCINDYSIAQFDKFLDYAIKRQLPFNKTLCAAKAYDSKNEQLIQLLKTKDLWPERPYVGLLLNTNDKEFLSSRLKSGLFSVDFSNLRLLHDRRNFDDTSEFICYFVKELAFELNIAADDIVSRNWITQVLTDILKITEKRFGDDHYISNRQQLLFPVLKPYYLRRHALAAMGISTQHIAHNILVRLDYTKSNIDNILGSSIALLLDMKTAIKKLVSKEDYAKNSDLIVRLAVLFPTVKEACEYIQLYKAQHPGTTQLLHDACLFKIALTNDWNKPMWLARLKQESFRASWMKLLGVAPLIESAVFGDLPPVEYVDNIIATKLYAGINAQIPKLVDKTKKYEEKLVGKNFPEDKNSSLISSHFNNQLQRFKNQLRIRVLRDYYERYILDNFAPDVTGTRWDRIVAAVPQLVAEFNKQDNIHSKNPKAVFLQWLINRLTFTRYSAAKLLKLYSEHEFDDVPVKYAEFAKEAAAAGLTRKYFDEIIKILEDNNKPASILPEIKFDAATIGLPGYSFEKVADKDPIQFILGSKTGCCQSINSFGRLCVLHGATSPFGGFYQIIYTNREQKTQIVAQSWAGLTVTGELLFDSIEWNKNWSPTKIMQIYQAVASIILEQNKTISRVIVGGGGATPKNHQLALIDDANNYKPIIGFNKVGYDSIDTRYILKQQKPENIAKFVVLPGLDTYVDAGKWVYQLELNHYYRHKFYRQHPNAKNLMSVVRQNPILEQGFLGDGKNARQGIGEMFLSYKAIEKLLPKLGLGNVIVSDNKKHLIQQLKLQQGTEIFICYVQNVQVTSAFIKRTDLTRVFIMDSEGCVDDEHPIVKAVQQVFAKNQIMTPKKRIQLDYYSCGTVAVKALKTFNRERASIFRNINLQHADVSHGVYLLPLSQIPADLLKLSQVKLPCVKLGESVSGKHKTLADYLKQHEVVIAGKAWRGAALATKYKMAAKLG